MNIDEVDTGDIEEAGVKNLKASTANLWMYGQAVVPI